jgi:hypothetical protein
MKTICPSPNGGGDVSKVPSFDKKNKIKYNNEWKPDGDDKNMWIRLFWIRIRNTDSTCSKRNEWIF